MTSTVSEIHVDDVGTAFEVTVKDGSMAVNISTATVKEIIFGKPDGTHVHKSASFLTDGSDGKIRYITVADDLNLDGIWSMQSYIEMPTGKWHSDVEKFTVFPNIS